MEYATREQAQNAVNTLSNQNLMGRLVYVREVSPLDISHEFPFWKRHRLTVPRIEKLSPDSLVPAAAEEALEAACRAVILATAAAPLEAVVDRSMSLTFVTHLFFPSHGFANPPS